MFGNYLFADSICIHHDFSYIYIMSQDPLNCTEVVVIKFRSKLGMLYIILLNHNHS